MGFLSEDKKKKSSWLLALLHRKKKQKTAWVQQWKIVVLFEMHFDCMYLTHADFIYSFKCILSAFGTLNLCIFSLVVLYSNNKEIHIIMLCVHLSFVFVVLRIENATPSEVRPTIPLTAQMPEGILFVEMMDINRQIHWNVEINRSRQDNAKPTYKYFQIVVCVCFSAD